MAEVGAKPPSPGERTRKDAQNSWGGRRVKRRLERSSRAGNDSTVLQTV